MILLPDWPMKVPKVCSGCADEAVATHLVPLQCMLTCLHLSLRRHRRCQHSCRALHSRCWLSECPPAPFFLADCNRPLHGRFSRVYYLTVNVDHGIRKLTGHVQAKALDGSRMAAFALRIAGAARFLSSGGALGLLAVLERLLR